MTTEQTAKELGSTLEQKIRANPLTCLAVALGAGFLAGGGVGSAIAGRLLRMGGGLAVRYLIVPAISQSVSRVLGISQSSEDELEGANA